ncbi:vanadium-dependent haloperoxidase [Persicitalea jodogahamensis]|uniref:vanadium-dependent haloperoxidase n=1 Tax=Persicitalea jodogahamensis TaxID=402147 RepID=UPI001E289AE0|nr:vanadium-dependent haloperoxidase [Persicitalea jodogahamensis]
MFHRAQKNLTRTIVHDIFSPPVASRVYMYANVAAYEILVLDKENYLSLHGQISGIPNVASIPAQGTINYPLAALQAFFKTGGKLVFSENLLQDSVAVLLHEIGEDDPEVYKNSLRFGQAVSDSILKWAAEDQYRETRRTRRYAYSKAPGKWIPTPPGYIPAVEPYWNRIRPLTLDSAQQFKPAPPPAFSTDPKSEFMRQTREVYDITRSMSKEQTLVASYWDCNPFYLNTQGHLNFATKKLSPGGHWMSIAGRAAATAKLDMVATAGAYLITSIALFDGFISCWDEKYRSQLIRPETVINTYIDEKWRPLLQTPPFPEYTSGHSVISTASATVLADYFGSAFAFVDDTEVEYGLPERAFGSFRAACDEAAISRLYGGIHYRAAIEEGQVQGELVGKMVLQKINLSQRDNHPRAVKSR